MASQAAPDQPGERTGQSRLTDVRDRSSAVGGARPTRGILRRHPSLPLALALVITGILTAWDAFDVLSRIDTPRYAADFYLYYLAAQLARAHGWSHLYDPSLFLPALHASSGRFMPYLNPPPMAALVLPLTFISYRLALVLWMGLMTTALLFAWQLAAPGRGLARFAHLTGVLGLFPVAFGIWLGQTTFLVVGAVALCWWLLKRGKEGWAGVALAVLAVKPQTAVLVPFALLLAGYRRAFLAWAGVTLVLVAGSLFSIGAGGLWYFRDSVMVVYGIPHLQMHTLLSVMGPGPIAPLASALAGALALLAAWRARGGAPEFPITVGLLGSLLVTPYLNVYDLTLGLLGAWLLLRTDPPRWHKVLLLLGYVPFEFAMLGAAPVVAFECVWLVSLLALSSRYGTGDRGRAHERAVFPPAPLAPGSRRPRRVVVLPAYRAAKTLRDVVARIPRDEVDHILLVDDASADHTAELALELGMDVILHPSNLGYGGNQKTCYANALLMGAEVVVMLHPDGQYDPSLVPDLCRAVEKGQGDVVLGSRWLGLDPAKSGMPGWKRLGNRFLTRMENWVLGLGLSEYHTGYRAYSRRFLETIPFAENSNDFVFDTQVLVQAARFGFRVAEIPAVGKYFQDASSVGLRTSVIYGLKTLLALGTYLARRVGVPCKWLTPRPSEAQRPGRLAA